MIERMIGLAYVKLLLRAANVRAASDNTSAESGPLHRLVSYPDWKRRALFAWMAFLLFVAAISRENFPLNVCNLKRALQISVIKGVSSRRRRREGMQRT